MALVSDYELSYSVSPEIRWNGNFGFLFHFLLPGSMMVCSVRFGGSLIRGLIDGSCPGSAALVQLLLLDLGVYVCGGGGGFLFA